MTVTQMALINNDNCSYYFMGLKGLKVYSPSCNIVVEDLASTFNLFYSIWTPSLATVIITALKGRWFQ